MRPRKGTREETVQAYGLDGEDGPGCRVESGGRSEGETLKSEGLVEEKTTRFNASRGDEIRIACSQCDNVTKHTVVSSVDVKERMDDFVDGGGISWTAHQIIRCVGCETYGFRRHHKDTDNFYIDGGEMLLIEAEEVYPPRLVGRKKLADSRDLPFKVRLIYGETYKCLVSEMPILAAVGIRGLVEAICQEQKAPGDNLKEKVDGLVSLGVLTRSGAEILHKLRLLGNESAHEMKRHPLWRLGIAFDVAEHVLQAVYLLPEKAERLK